MHKNKKAIIEKATALGLTLGCYSPTIEKLNTKEFAKVLESMEYQEDTDVLINRKLHVVEIDIVDSEIDFSVLTKAEYINRYGNERWDSVI